MCERDNGGWCQSRVKVADIFFFLIYLIMSKFYSLTHIQINIVFLKDKGSFQIMLSLYLERKDFISFVFYRNSYLIKEDLLKELVSHAVMLF